MSIFDFQRAFAQLHDEYLASAIEQLDRMDATIDRLHGATGDARHADSIDFQRDAHSLKGSAGTYGFASVGLIAHRLEDYLETTAALDSAALADAQIYIDRMRAILESGADAPADRVERLLRELPRPAQPHGGADAQNRVALLVSPKGAWRSLMSNALAAAGFELAYSDHPIEAFGLALTLKPDLLVSSVEFDKLSGIELAGALRAVAATAATPVLLTTSHDIGELGADLPDTVRVIPKDRNVTEALGRTLRALGLVAAVAAQ